MFKQPAAAQSGLLELCPGIKTQTAVRQQRNPHTIITRRRLPSNFSHLDLKFQQLETRATKSLVLSQDKSSDDDRFNLCTLNNTSAIRSHPQVSTFVQLSSDAGKALYPPFVIFADWNFQCRRNSQPTTPTSHPHCRSFLSHWRFIILDTSSANSPGGQERSSFHPMEHHQASPGTCN